MRSRATVPYLVRGAIIALLLMIAAGLPAGPAGIGPEPRSAQAASLNEVRKLLASDAQPEDAFGTSVAVSGDTAIVGADGEDAGGSVRDDFGAAYVLQRDRGGPGNWGEVKKLAASDIQAGDHFGASVAISGDIAVVGAWGETAGGAGFAAGAAYVFGRNEGGTDNWGQVAKLTASDAQLGGFFGTSVAVGGDTAIVGADGVDAGSGAAYIFQRDEGSQDNWGEVKKLTASDAQAGDFFGFSVAIGGDTIAVGSPQEPSFLTGAAYVFQRNEGSQDNWGEVKKLTASDAQAGNGFGWSVAVSGDAAVVGAPFEGTGAGHGAAYVFGRDQGSQDNWGEVAKLTASDAGANDLFGWSAAVSGDTAVVGALREDAGGEDAGAAYVFNVPERVETELESEFRKLLASDAQAFDGFGLNVAVSGDAAVVSGRGGTYIFQRNQGGPSNWGEVAGLTASGVVAISGDTAVVGALVFQRNEGGQDNWGEVTELIAAGVQELDDFGVSVAVSGQTIIVGADGDDGGGANAGAAYVFERNEGGTDNWGEVAKLTASDAQEGDIFGESVAVSVDTAVVGASWEDSGASNAGAAYVFSRDEGGQDNWGEVTKLLAADAGVTDRFGNSVAVSGGTAVVGAVWEDAGGCCFDDPGAAYVFKRSQGGADNWGQVAKLIASDAQAGALLGISVAVSGDAAVVGSWADSAGGSQAGAAYVFRRSQGGADKWGEIKKLTASDAQASDLLGNSVAISGDTVIVGAPEEDAEGQAAGAVYVFEEAPMPNDGSLGGVSDIVVGSVNTGTGLFSCIAKTDHSAGDNSITTYLQCDLKNVVADSSVLPIAPPAWRETCVSLSEREPPACVPGQLNEASEAGAGTTVAPAPPYTGQAPMIGRGFYYPGGTSPSNVCAANDCTIVTSCFQDTGPIVGTGPNIIWMAIIKDPKGGGTFQADTDGDTLGDTQVDRVSIGVVNIWYNQNNANCTALTPEGAPDFAALPVESIYAYGKGGSNPNPNPAPWRASAPGSVLDFDGDGCTDEQELDPNSIEKCGDDPRNPSDSFTIGDDLSGAYDVLVEVSRGDCGNPCVDNPEPGIYFFCRADVQHDTGDNSIVVRPYCYWDSVAVEVNPEALPGLTGDGMAGAPPPGPQDTRGHYAYGDVDTAHSELTGTFNKTMNNFEISGCIQDLDGNGAGGNVYVEMTVSAHQRPGTADIWISQPADCAGSPVGAPSFASTSVAIWQPNPDEGNGYDPDQDGVPSSRELQDESRCGRRDPYNKNDYYDVSIPRDGVINLQDDILGVILRFAPGGYLPGDENWDRPPAMVGRGAGSNWNRGSPDGRIDLANDILGVVLQFNPGGCLPPS